MYPFGLRTDKPITPYLGMVIGDEADLAIALAM
jgi:hypothetical protein